MDKTIRHRLACFVCLVLASLGMWFVLRHYLALETLVEHEARLRDMANAQPIRIVAISLVTYVLLSLVPGLAGKSVVCGWLLGFAKGLFVVNVGLTLAALVAFLVSRYLIRDAIRTHVGWFLQRLRRGIHDDEDYLFLLTLRLFHAPYTLVNYAIGATEVSARRFWWTTQLGLLPGNIALVLAGASLPSLEQLGQQGLWSVVNIPLLAGLTAVGFLPLASRWLFQRTFHKTRHDTC